MMKYDKYKPSEIDFLEYIPNDWEVKRLKSLGDIRYGLGQPPKQLPDGLPIIRATNVSFGKITPKNMLFVDPDDLPYDRNPILKTNDIIVVRSGAYTGDSAIIPLDYNGAVTGYDMVYTPIYVNPKFISYSILSDYVFKDQLVMSSLRAAQPHLNKEELGSTLVFIPNKVTQNSIVNFLDNKCEAIDKKISLLTQKANYYKEYRKSLINETVCKGLDKNVKLKDSGIDWIGQIPEHWDIVRLKSLGNIETSSVNKKIEENEGLIKLVNYTDVYGNSNKEIWNDDSYMVVSANVKQLQSKLLKKGDVLFTPSSETIEDIGVSAVVMENLKNTLYSYHLLRLRFSKNVFLNFKKYLFNNDFVQNYFSKSATGTTRKILGLSTLNNLLVILPPTLKEQEEIATYLDEKTQTIDKIVTNINTQIVTLKELRKTLINDAVTGKIKVINNN
jgi:type I restriction enzyme S subunit